MIFLAWPPASINHCFPDSHLEHISQGPYKLEDRHQQYTSARIYGQETTFSLHLSSCDMLGMWVSPVEAI